MIELNSESDHVAILYVPCGSEEEAATIARTLLSEGLITCGNIYTSRSLYWWEGKIADEPEYVLFAKTTADLASTAAYRINELQSYNVPCILTIRSDAVNEAYKTWITNQVARTASAVQIEE